MDAFHDEYPGTFRKANFVDLLGRMLDSGRALTARYCAGHWLDVNSVQDLEYAEQLYRTLGNGSASVTAGS
jgi:NDP-sugar pyrophosphorylase family protein